MRQITLNQRELRLLRDTLTGKEEGYDYTDLRRLDFLAGKMTDLMGAYATTMAELAREEKKVRRQHRKSEITLLELNKALDLIRVDVMDLHDEAEAATVQLRLEDGDYKLVANVLEGIQRWAATDDVRHLIISMREAVANAEKLEDLAAEKPAQDESDAKVSRIKRTG